MSADLQMVRGNIDGGYNLSIGDPYVIQNHLKLPYFNTNEYKFPYPSLGGHPTLIDEIKQVYDYKYVVIANGCKGALLASIYALKKYRKVTDSLEVKAPYWPSFSTLAKLSGLEFNKKSLDSITIGVSPNNPDGTEVSSADYYNIWDASYASNMYSWSGKRPHHVIQVCSAAKLLGLSGLRVGWLLTDIKELADSAAEYVESTCSGVATPNQLHVALCLKYMRTETPWEDIQSIKNEFIDNGELIRERLSLYYDDIYGAGNKGAGMFSFVKIKENVIPMFEESIKKSKIALVKGKTCGAEEGWYRISCGNSKEYTKKAINALIKELDGYR